MIVAAAFCPHPPVLIPEVAQAAASELDDVRAACRSAIQCVALPGRQLVVLGPGPSSLAHLSHARGTLAGYGVDLEVALGTSATDGRVELPLSLTVGAWLVRDALGADSRSVGCSVGPDDPAGRSGDLIKVAAGVDTVLIVMGDGSARRSSAAPGYLDDRAEIFDTQVAAALRGGDSVALSAIDAQIGAELLAAGVPAWHAAAVLLQGRQHDAQLLYADAPYGVGYFVAAWTAGG